uniref:Uncharacterized protein n=1 Tax=Poecilia latipinna TaxID=48699 RepID=A0A3B3VPW0_9TELE
MSLTPSASASLQPAKMKKDESFLGKLGGTLVRKKRAKEGEDSSIVAFEGNVAGRRRRVAVLGVVQSRHSADELCR